MATQNETSTEPVGETPTFELSERLATHHAATLAENIQQLSGRDLDLDASNVELVSTPCLQVLLAAAGSWRKDSLKLRLLEPSEPFVTTLKHLGISLDAFQSTEVTQ